MDILSFGAGTQSTALALMACENAMAKGKLPHPMVPIFDAVIICDLGLEAPWVYKQMHFVKRACEKVGIPFYIIDSPLYKDYMRDYGHKRVVSIPWWTKKDNGKEGKVGRRFCTLDYKTDKIASFVKWELLGYKKGSQIKEQDRKAHVMHIGFSAEEEDRCQDNPHPLFRNRFLLQEMGLDRAANYKYILDVWGLDTKASACSFCPFHKNYFFQYMKEHEPEHYQQIVEFDNMLGERKPRPEMGARFFMSHSFKRIEELTPEDCDDGEFFTYCGKCSGGKPVQVWNGF